jgi:hypothetical protein
MFAPPMQQAIHFFHPWRSSRVYLGTEEMGTMYSLADMNPSKKVRMMREAMTELKNTADIDVDIALTSRAQMPIYV